MVKKIFTVLISIVACVVVGAFVLNIVAPNVLTSMSSAVEGMIYNATKISVDINGDGKGGKANKSGEYNKVQSDSGTSAEEGVGVDGFE